MDSRTDFSGEFFSVMTSASGNEQKVDILLQFIGRIENNTLELSNKTFETYFLAFETLADITDPVVKKTGFKAYRKLVAKRAMAGSMKSKEARSIAIICFSNLGDELVVARCTRIIEDVFYSFLKEFTSVLNDIILPSGDFKILLGTLSWLAQPQISQDSLFDVSHIIPAVVTAMNNSFKKARKDLYDLFVGFLSDYFQNGVSVSAADKVAYNQVQSTSIHPSVRQDILSIIEVKPSVPSYLYQDHSSNASPLAVEAYSSLGLQSPFDVKKTKTVQHSPQPLPMSEDISPMKDSPTQDDEDVHLQNFIKKLEHYELEESKDLQPINDCDDSDLAGLTKKYSACFIGKESELNWSKREGFIREMRKIVRGNIVKDDLEKFKSFVQTFAEAISKAMESLRTVLSSSAAYLVKEMALILGPDFDSLVDLFFQTLINVCLRKKSITSKVAFTVVCAILINCSYSPKYLMKIKACMEERRDTTFHAFSASWLQIIIIRFHSIPSLFNKTSNQYSTGPKTPLVHEMLKSLLSDANVTVRQAARDAFWAVCHFSPRDKELIFISLDPKTQKMVEREAPPEITFTGKVPATNKRSDKPTANREISAMAPTLTSVSRSNSRTVSRAPSRTATRTSASRPVSRTSSTGPTSNYPGTVARSARSTTPTYASGTIASTTAGQMRTAKLSGSISKREHVRGKSSSNDQILEEFKRKQTETLERKRSLKLNSGDSQVPHYARPTRTAEAHKPHQPKSYPHVEQPKQVTRVDAQILQAGPQISYTNGHFDDKPITPVETSVASPVVTATASEYPLLDQLMSKDVSTISQGIDGLKYAVRYDEESEIPGNISNVISDLSKTHIKTLRPLFEYTGIPKIFRIFNPADLLRAYAILFKTATAQFFEEVSQYYKAGEVYQAINQILTDCLSTLHLLKSEPLYGKQLATYKPVLIDFILNYLLVDISNAATEEHFPVISNNLFSLFKQVYRSFDLYSEVLKSINKKIPQTFNTCLAQFDTESTKFIRKMIEGRVSGELEALDLVGGLEVSSDEEFDTTQNLEKEDMSKMIDLHELAIGSGDEAPRGHSPNMETDVVLMHNMKHQKEADSNNQPLEHKVSEYEYRSPTPMDIDVAGTDAVVIDSKAQPIEVEEEDVAGNDRHKDSGLADEFSQIDIIGKKEPEEKDPYQTLVEKVDPLKARAERGKQINIFQDDEKSTPQRERRRSGHVHRSQERVIEYDYTELNWFNFQLAHHPKRGESTFSIVEFETLVSKLGSGRITNDDTLILVNYLQNNIDFTTDFADYFWKQGKTIIEHSLWAYFEQADHARDAIAHGSSISNGLILVKQLLISNVNLDICKLLSTMITVSNIKDERMSMEVNFAINEVFDEVLKHHPEGVNDMLKTVMGTVKQFNTEEPKPKLLITFEILLKIVDNHLKSVTVDPESLKEFVDGELHVYLGHNSVDIRRLVVLIYAKLIAHFQQNNVTIDDITNRLNTYQKKLIDYYSKN